MAAKDYYEILGVPRSANEDELKNSYRKLVREFHPDQNKDNPDSEKKMAEINEAYSVLSNKEKRAKYDQFGQVPPEGSYPGGGYGGVNFTDDFGSVADIFDQMFGGGGGRARSHNVVYEGADIRTEVSITLEEAFLGKKFIVEVPRMDKCSECNGTGAAKGTTAETCTSCKGNGQIRRTQQTFLGSFQTVGTCPTCGGAGKIIKSPCPKCNGETVVKAIHKIEVEIPTGIEDSMRIRLAGQGNAGQKGGKSGDLYVYVHVKEHKVFKREGSDLHSTVTISMYEAALGAKITIYTIEGKELITIKPGTQPGDTLGIKSKGMPHLNSKRRGDQIITFKITIPKKLSQREKQGLKDLSKLEGVESDV